MKFFEIIEKLNNILISWALIITLVVMCFWILQIIKKDADDLKTYKDHQQVNKQKTYTPITLAHFKSPYNNPYQGLRIIKSQRFFDNKSPAKKLVVARVATKKQTVKSPIKKETIEQMIQRLEREAETQSRHESIADQLARNVARTGIYQAIPIKVLKGNAPWWCDFIKTESCYYVL